MDSVCSEQECTVVYRCSVSVAVGWWVADHTMMNSTFVAG